MHRLILVIATVLILCGINHAQPKKYSFVQRKMGSPFKLVLVADDSIHAVGVAEQCFSLVDSLNVVFSDYDSSSELSKVSRSAGSGIAQPVSPHLWDVLMRARKAFQVSGGVFDIATGALSIVWRQARVTKSFPSRSVVRKAKRASGFRHLEFDTIRHTVLLRRPGLRLDLGGIAKGYIAQQVIAFAAAMGISSALADAGGDIVVSEAPSGTLGWTIGVAAAEGLETMATRLSLTNTAVATSGDVYQHIDHRGHRYSHIINPKTGYGIHNYRNVTVVASDGATADWLATACSILPPARARQLAAAFNAKLIR